MIKSLIIDKNLSYKLTIQVSRLLGEATHVSNEGLDSTMDIDIWRFAKERNMAILTKDTDFKTLSSLFGCPPKVIRLNCGNKTTYFILELLVSKAEVIENFLINEDDCYLELA